MLIFPLILVASVTLLFVCYFHTMRCHRDYDEVIRLTAPTIVPDLSYQNNMPITNGVLVDNINEDLTIITVD